MIDIKNTEDLRRAYSYLRFFREHEKNDALLAPNARECAAALKKAIRGYTHRPLHEDVIVKDYGIDGYVIRFPLPDHIDSKTMAKAYFEDRCKYHYRPSQYDCTGQLFTRWYKLFLRNGRWWAYHSVGCDV